MTADTEAQIAQFLGEGICVARNPEGKIAAIFAHNYRFKIPELTKVLFGSGTEFRIRHGSSKNPKED